MTLMTEDNRSSRLLVLPPIPSGSTLHGAFLCIGVGELPAVDEPNWEAEAALWAEDSMEWAESTAEVTMETWPVK